MSDGCSSQQRYRGAQDARDVENNSAAARFLSSHLSFVSPRDFPPRKREEKVSPLLSTSSNKGFIKKCRPVSPSRLQHQTKPNPNQPETLRSTHRGSSSAGPEQLSTPEPNIAQQNKTRAQIPSNRSQHSPSQFTITTTGTRICQDQQTDYCTQLRRARTEKKRS